MKDVSIVTRRLVLTPLGVNDVSRLLEYRSDPGVSRYQFFEPHSEDDARRFILGGPPDLSAWHQFGIRLKASDLLVGDAGIRFPSGDTNQAEVGVTVAPDHQRQGIASEVLAAVLEHLFCTVGTHRVFASVDPRNAASMALFARLGMRREAHFRQSLWFKGEWADDVVFGMLRSEWTLSAARQATESREGGK